MEKLKIGLIATGGRGRNGWQAHNPDKGEEIVAGVDVNPEAQKAFKEQFPDAQLFDDYRDLLKQKEIGAVFKDDRLSGCIVDNRFLDAAAELSHSFYKR